MGQTYKLVLATVDIGNIHVVRRGTEILKLLAREDVQSHKMHLGVSVLARLRGRHVDDLAGTALDDDMTVLPQRRALHGIRSRGAGIGGLKSMLMLEKESC